MGVFAPADSGVEVCSKRYALLWRIVVYWNCCGVVVVGTN